MLKLNLSVLNALMQGAGSAIDSLSTNRDACHNAVMNLTQDGFTGVAQVACLESFNAWINQYDVNADGLTGLYIVCEQALVSANTIRRQCENLAGTIGAPGHSAPENTGEIALGDDFSSVGLGIRSILDIELPALEGDLTLAIGEAGFVSGAGTIGGLLADLHEELLTQSSKLQSLVLAWDGLVSSALAFEDGVTNAFNAVKDGDSEQLEQAFNFLSQNAGDLLTAAAGAAWNASGVVNPDNINVRYEGGYVRMSGYTGADSLGPRYRLLNALSGRPGKVIAFKGLKMAGSAVGVVMAGVNIYNDCTGEYDRNPYLPESVKVMRATAAAEFSVIKNGATVGAGIAIGAAIGVWAGPAGIIAGAIIGAGVGWIIDRASESDIDGNGKSLTDDYIDARYEAMKQISYTQPDYSWANGVNYCH
jgi:hypothetical protein